MGMWERERRDDVQDGSFIDIDEMQLHKEWLNQPRLYLQYASKLADATHEFDEAKSQLEVTKSEIDADIRRDPDSYNLEKVTETSIANTIPMQEPYREATNNLLEAKHRRDVLDAAVTALDHRRKALEKLVDLHLSGYFAAPKSSGDQAVPTSTLNGPVRRKKKSRKDSNNG